MDAERLTPYLRRRVLRLSAADRAVLVGELSRSLTAETDSRRSMGLLAERMHRISGINVYERSRIAPVVQARSIFVYVCRLEGYSQNEIARELDMDHSTIHYLERRVRDAFAMPQVYHSDIELYNKYTSEIL